MIVLTYTFDTCLCLVLLNFDICKCLLLGRDCISQYNISYDQFHIQAIIEQIMDP
jgi:hypothetical protein